MDFFEAQDRARRKTWQLVLLFAIAIVGLIVATNVLLAVVTAFSSTPGARARHRRRAAGPVRGNLVADHRLSC